MIDERERMADLLYEAQYRHMSVEETVDLLQDHGVIWPQCKVGDMVYYIAENPFDETKSIQVGFITRIYVGDRWMSYALGSEYGRFNIGICKSENVFLSKAEAERALKECEKHE